MFFELNIINITIKSQENYIVDIKHLRQNYSAEILHKKELEDCPFVQFEKWFKAAIDAKVYEPNAMALATASKSGRPSCRIVLLKHFDKSGFCFFTNYESRKGKDLLENPYATMTIWWKELMQQVIIEGSVIKVSPQESEEYFNLRPRKSQISAYTSHQDEVIKSREFLEKAFFANEEKFSGKDIPKPAFWGGFRLIPDRFEFWQGQRDRLHDRFQYTFPDTSNQNWLIQRLSP